MELLLPLIGLDYARVWEPDPELGWHLIPGARRIWTSEGRGLIEVNSLGYRDRERQVEKVPRTFRIAVFGDSMTEAVQVNLGQTFCYLLEEQLKRRGIRNEVLNFGVSGYSPIQELLLFKREGLRFRPDLVIVAVFLDNDISGVHPDLTVVYDSGPPFVTFTDEAVHFDYSRAQQSFTHYHREPFYSFRKYFSIYRLLSDWRWRHRDHRQERGVSGDGIQTRYLLYQTPHQPEWEKAWVLFERAMLEFAEEAHRQQVKLAILSVPASQVVNRGAWQNILNTSPAMAHFKWDLEGPEQRLQNFAAAHNILLLQPYKVYQQATKSPALFFGDVGHMTPHGHMLMAQFLEDFLRQQELLP
jgi:lysophospholipase L1-like esterase